MEQINSSFEAIIQKVKSYLPEQNTEILNKAYELSLQAHREQTRAGGAPFITHPLAVANILTELQMDIPTLAASLLHDVLEDTSVTRDALRAEFGDEIMHLVEGVTKIESIEEITHEYDPVKASTPELVRQAENWRKMLIATAHDIRVIFLKLADRKHNMETLEFLPEERRKRIAEETLNLYAPLAQRLGMYALKSSLEDLSLKHLNLEKYTEIEKKLGETRDDRNEFIKNFVEKIEKILSGYAIVCRILTRQKNINSIYRKMLRQNKPFEEIQDIAGVRLITDSVEHCYALLGAMHNNFTPVEKTFTDYITMPKNNLYQSLHTTVYAQDKRIMEIQIRTEEMHRIAEYGVAAHWKYKQSKKEPTAKEKDSIDDKLDWIKQILEWQQETKNPREFLEGLRIELAFDQVFVFTPKGEVKKLPVGSTPVDFAFAVHTELGFQCVGAKVGGKMVRLDYQLKSGDICEIQTRKGRNPHKDWLDFVKTPRARSKIRKFMREQ